MAALAVLGVLVLVIVLAYAWAILTKPEAFLGGMTGGCTRCHYMKKHEP